MLIDHGLLRTDRQRMQCNTYCVMIVYVVSSCSAFTSENNMHRHVLVEQLTGTK